jgi:hypothetical protein
MFVGVQAGKRVAIVLYFGRVGLALGESEASLKEVHEQVRFDPRSPARLDGLELLQAKLAGFFALSRPRVHAPNLFPILSVHRSHDRKGAALPTAPLRSWLRLVHPFQDEVGRGQQIVNDVVRLQTFLLRK